MISNIKIYILMNFGKKESFVIFENYSNSWVPMIDKDFINDSFIPEKPGQLLKEMKNDYVKGGLISEGIFNMVPSSKKVQKHYPQFFHFWLQS